MNRTEISSSNIKSVGYDKQTRILEVEFNNNQVYQYYDVEDRVFSELMSAESKGKYFYENIRKNYSYFKVN
jgi:hypothetical protein